MRPGWSVPKYHWGGAAGCAKPFIPGANTYLEGAVPAGAVVSVYGAHLLVQAAEGTCGWSARVAPSFSPRRLGLSIRPNTVSLIEAKRKLRDQAKARRADLHQDAGAAAQRQCALFVETFEAELARSPAPAVSGSWPMGDEFDVRPLMIRLSERGHVCALPIVVARGEALVFRRWRPGDRLAEAGFGTHEPGAEAAEAVPDIVIVPLLAFDDA